ncbi:hypothetical protein HR45_18540 [Shewanella mangrovi]|uniref:Exopolysaccharide biosynthesis protein n=1 Tax=Shewanella mangrovi TaxID=1515746 RepID=A0A094J9Z0_9GAMM|nr:Rcs stress response system protein RcsF [Shewanella mangrovi]KFZ36077.1 hypothetical protein HR45_18540 [Shewanella mangrovi]
MKYLIPVVSVLLLSACSSDYVFKSNLDADAINDYFKPSQVKLFDKSMPSGPYVALGMIEGSDCQIDQNAAPASLANARTDARRKAADMKANGLIIKKCAEVPEPAQGCFTRTLCVGQAIKLKTE